MVPIPIKSDKIDVAICSYRYFTSKSKGSFSKKSERLQFYDVQGQLKCQGPPGTMILDSGATQIEPRNNFREIIGNYRTIIGYYKTIKVFLMFFDNY